ncbi:MAG: hypothetical protein JWQ66_936 [Mucilaginibacter sp.]|nr:hypothetical protein [Mucilaginibacter sp.]
MKIIYIPLFIIASFFIACRVSAQTSQIDKKLDSLDDLEKIDKKGSFKIGINYLNNIVFMGRADTVTTPVILPELKYTFKNGIFISAGVDYIPNRVTSKLDEGSLVAGYDYDITDNLSGGVSFTKMFYNTNSTQIGSSISSTFSANLTYDIASIITPTIGADYNFIKQGFGNDIFINAGLSHDFAKEGILGDKDLFILSPAVTINAGTQNFYDAYLTLKKYKLTAKAQAKEAAAEKLITKRKVQLSKFNILDYEFSAPIEYKAGILILSFTPTYTIAENKLPPRITAGMVSGNIFYFETGAALKF